MKHTLKKSLALFLAVLMAVLCAPLAFADDVVTGDCGDHVTYTWNKGTGAVTISGIGPMWDYDDWNNPSPFNESWNVRAIVIESGVTSVGEYAFSFCIYLQDVSFPYGLETIGKGAFLSTGLKNASLPRTVTRIGELAFQCADLVSVTLPKGLTAIQNSAFFYNEDLQTLNYTGSPADWDAITIGEDAFENTPLSAPTCYYYGVDGAMNAIDAIGENDGSDAYLGRIATAYVLYSKLSDTEKSQVTNADDLTAAKNAVPGYEFGVCGDCVGYAWDKTAGKLVIGGIGDMKDYDTFDNNNLPPWYGNNLSSIVVGSGVTGIGNGAFYHFGGTPSVSLPEGLTKIGYRAFYFCEELQNIVLPESLTEIGEQAFYGCYKLESMTIPDNVKKIGASTFCGCYSLVSFTIPDNVKSIGISAFSECKALQTVTIHDGITEIGESAFLNCPKLKTVNFTGSEAQWNVINKGKYIFDYYDYEAFEYCDRPAEETPVFIFYYGVEGAMNAINDIGEVEYTDECKARIDEARKAYDRLSDYETTLVTNYAALTKAEEDYAALETAALLAAAKTAAKEELAAYKNADDYRDAQKTELAEAIAAGEAAIDAATDIDAVADALTAAKAAIDAIKTDAQLTAEEAAAALAAGDEIPALTVNIYTYGTGSSAVSLYYGDSTYRGKSIREYSPGNEDITVNVYTPFRDQVTDAVLSGLITGTEVPAGYGSLMAGAESVSGIKNFVGAAVCQDDMPVDGSVVAVKLSDIKTIADTAAKNAARAAAQGFVDALNAGGIEILSSSVGTPTVTAKYGGYATDNAFIATYKPSVTETVSVCVNTSAGDYTIQGFIDLENKKLILNGDVLSMLASNVTGPAVRSMFSGLGMPIDSSNNADITKLLRDSAYDAAKDAVTVVFDHLSALAEAKAAAKTELENYKDPADYRLAQQDELTAAISDGNDAIDAATDIDAVADALTAAKAAIDAIKTDAQLTAEEFAADTAAADAVEAKIDAIGEVAYTDESKAKIDAAQDAFDALTDTQKALVENKGTLDAAAKKYAELKAEAEKPTEPIEPTDGDVCPICGKTEHDNHRDQVLHAVFVFVHDLVIYVLIPLIKHLSE